MELRLRKAGLLRNDNRLYGENQGFLLLLAALGHVARIYFLYRFWARVVHTGLLLYVNYDLIVIVYTARSILCFDATYSLNLKIRSAHNVLIRSSPYLPENKFSSNLLLRIQILCRVAAGIHLPR